VFDFYRKRLDSSTPVIIGRLVEIGIIAHKDGYISFIFGCYQEHFLAKAINEDPNLFSAVNVDLLTALTREVLGLPTLA